MDEREPWEFEQRHSPYTPEGQIEAYGLMARRLSRHRVLIGRIALAAALVLMAVAVTGLLRSV